MARNSKQLSYVTSTIWSREDTPFLRTSHDLAILHLWQHLQRVIMLILRMVCFYAPSLSCVQSSSVFFIASFVSVYFCSPHALPCLKAVVVDYLILLIQIHVFSYL